MGAVVFILPGATVRVEPSERTGFESKGVGWTVKVRVSVPVRASSHAPGGIKGTGNTDPPAQKSEALGGVKYLLSIESEICGRGNCRTY